VIHMAKIGLIDCDSHNFPNLPLMKLSAWHKEQGDSVEWYSPLLSGCMDTVYMSKVFTFTPEYAYHINAKKVIIGGTGFKDTRESVFNEQHRKHGYYYNKNLPAEIESLYPDYSLYQELTKDTAFDFMTRGCPRNCEYCVVPKKEGRKSRKVADLRQFWDGQKKIKLLDPNITACKDWENLFGQLVESRALIDFTQGLDIRLMTEPKIEMIKKMRIKYIHFAFDDISEKKLIVEKLKHFKESTGWNYWKMTVYVLVNYNSTLEEDLERIYTLRDLGYSPFVMIYEKERLPARHELKQLQRWVNMRAVFRSVNSFNDYVDK